METTPLLPKPARLSLWAWLKCCICPYFGKRKKYNPRVIKLGQVPDDVFPPNKIRNQKYNICTFLPIVLFQQFKYFLNLYFLIMALSQFIPDIRIGYLYTYWAPLCFVISITIIREATDDIGRFRRDKCINSEKYIRLVLQGNNKGSEESVNASKLRVGDILMLQRGQRVPADVILLRTPDRTGSVFVATDQLDGETDWKVRLAVSTSQKIHSDAELLDLDVTIFAEQPQSDIHSFIGTWNSNDSVGLDVQQTIWSESVLQSSHATCIVIYTGSETRSMMNNSIPRSKIGQFDLKVNNMTIMLFCGVVMLSFLMISLKGFSGPWFRYFCRFILLFSYIIPISLRVNLDVGKYFYAFQIKKDKKIDGSFMRSTNIPEEMGRVSYLLTDKTGTVTKNEMSFKKLCIANMCYGESYFDEVETLLTQHVTKEGPSLPVTPSTSFNTIDVFTNENIKTSVSGSQIWEAVLGMALCHNVTPVYDSEDDAASSWDDKDTISSAVSESKGGTIPQQQLCNYQAASPDEVALVKWTDSMGVSLYRRDLTSISLKLRSTNEVVSYNILEMFPFTSETKCMGIIVQDIDTCEITFFLKGADVVLHPLVGPPSWLQVQSDKLASEGLRTLVFAKKRLSLKEYESFKEGYKHALASLHNRTEHIEDCIDSLHNNLQLLSVTGVEDRLADSALYTMNLLRVAGIKIWMLTGDKLETALCIAKSLHFVNARNQGLFVFEQCTSRVATHSELMRLKSAGRGCTLIIAGDSFDNCNKWHKDEFSALAIECASVVVARCSPTQKAYMVELLQQFSKGSVCAVGDGGNDVPMIRQSDIGIGIEGREGKAASLAGDVSIREFKYLSRLLLVHGRRSRLRSSTLSFFVIHRGLIISTMQAIFSTVFYLSSVSLYQGMLMVGYGTFFTTLPVFSLVLDKDITSKKALEFPNLYRDLVKERIFSYKLFFVWVGISIFQGGMIMYFALLLFESEFIHIVAISFSALIFIELAMVALTIRTCHRLIWLAELISIIIYFISLYVFRDYFDINYILSITFVWKVLAITLIGFIPIWILKLCYVRSTKKKIIKVINP